MFSVVIGIAKDIVFIIVSLLNCYKTYSEIKKLKHPQSPGRKRECKRNKSQK